MAAGFKETWNNIPYVTRHISALSVALLLVYIINPYWAVLGWRLPSAPKWQVWRYVLAPFSYNGNSINGLLQLYSFCIYLNQLETTVFRARSKCAYYFLWIAVLFNIIGPYIGAYAYLNGVMAALTYTQAQETPLVDSVFLVVPLKMRYIPLARVAFAFVASGGAISGIYEELSGILIAHSFLFFTEIMPTAGGPKVFSSPPRFLVALDKLEEEERKRGSYGTGRRLG